MAACGQEEMTNTEIIKTIETNKMPNQTETIFFVLSSLWVTGGCSPSTKCFLRYRYPLLWPYKRLLTFLFEPARPLVQIVIFRQPTGHKTRFDIFQTRKKNRSVSFSPQNVAAGDFLTPQFQPAAAFSGWCYPPDTCE